MSFVDHLVQQGIINQYQIDDIHAAIEKANGNAESALAEFGLEEAEIARLKSEYYKLPYRKVDRQMIPYEALGYIPEQSARHYGIVPVGITDKGVLEVGMVNPDSMEAYNALQFLASKNKISFQTYLISNADFADVLESYTGVSQQVDETILPEGVEQRDTEEFSKVLDEVSEAKMDTKKIVEDAPVTKMVAVILRHAVEGRASDVHIEHTGQKVKVRFRVDGVLHTSLWLDAKIHSALVARVKILSKLKIDEKRRPQDGRFPAKIDGRKVDFRVSTFPTAYGEKVVIRILDPERNVKSLEEAGMFDYHTSLVRQALARPYGLILITGPTGSGKTTTLYSMLRELDREKRNVVSLEDPVEYLIDGVSQSQVRPEIGYSFADGLRSVLRQDPDIVMVGEIRDRETAELAIQAALTGHLVLSTLHTNSAIGVIPRLVDMGIDPYLIAPTLNLAIAQRLVKRICTGAEQELAADESVRMMLENQFADLPQQYRKQLSLDRKLYEAKNTPGCPSGVRGRIAVYEMFMMNPELESTVLREPTEEAIFKVARKYGMLTMKDDAVMKSMEGHLPFYEVNSL